MNRLCVITYFAIIAITSAEPPVHHGGDEGYTYSLESADSAHGIGTNAYTTVGGDYSYSEGGHDDGYEYIESGHGGSSNALIGGGGYTAVSGGYQTYEGKHVDPTLLHKVKEILVEHENLEEIHRGISHGGVHNALHHGGHEISSVYGVPHYGVPSYNSKVVGIELGHITPSIQVAQYHQSQHLAVPSHSYGSPAIHLSIPSGTYGVPSGSYGVPHH